MQLLLRRCRDPKKRARGDGFLEVLGRKGKKGKIVSQSKEHPRDYRPKSSAALIGAAKGKKGGSSFCGKEFESIKKKKED